MTHVRIESAMAADINMRLTGVPVPYEEITWEGEVDLRPFMRPGAEATSAALLEAVFRAFNRVEIEDNDRLEEIGYRLPSLSVGDAVEINGDRWRCKSVGWEREKSERRTRGAAWPA